MAEYEIGKDPAYQADQQKVADALATVQEALAPRSCPHEADWEECHQQYDTCLYADTKPRPGYVLTKWVVVGCMESMAEDQGYTIGTTAPRQRTFETTGLLTEGLEII